MRFPGPEKCQWCGTYSLINKPSSPCLDCINSNNAKVFSNKALPIIHIGRKMSTDIAKGIAAYFVMWHNAQALYRRQYTHLLTVMAFDELSNGPIDLEYVPEPEDPMDIILDMLYPQVSVVTKEELDEMPTLERVREDRNRRTPGIDALRTGVQQGYSLSPITYVAAVDIINSAQQHAL